MTRDEWHRATDDRLCAMLDHLKEAGTLSPRRLGLWAAAACGHRREPSSGNTRLTSWSRNITGTATLTVEDASGMLYIRNASPGAAALLRCAAGDPWRPLPAYRSDDIEYSAAWLTPTVLSLARAIVDNAGEPCGRCGGGGFAEFDLRPKGGPERDDGRRYVMAPPKTVSMPCPHCDGTGRVGLLLDPQRLLVLSDALEEGGCPTVEHWCEACRGKGGRWAKTWGYDANWVDCATCAGAGRILHPLLAHLRNPGPHCTACHALALILGDDQ